MRQSSGERYFGWSLIVGLCLLGVLLAAAPAGAQYFGRNKVLYDRLDFKVIKTQHFDIFFYPQEQKAVETAARLAERWYARLSRIFNFELKTRQPLVLYGSHPQFEETTVTSEILTEGTGGFTEPLKRRVVLPFGGTLAETDHVIGHELVHAFQFALMAQSAPGGRVTESAALRLPLWFIEGMAEYFSIGPVDVNTAMWMRDAVREKKMPTIKQMSNSYRYFPYRYGQALWAYIGGRYGDLIISRLLREAGRSGDYEKVMERVLGEPVKKLSEEWHESMKKDYLALTSTTKTPKDFGPEVQEGSETVSYNVSPAVSPDGQRFIFLSSKELFSIELYLANAKNGKITGQVTKTVLDPHLQSLEFINSSGSWNHEGTKFVFGAIRDARPILAIVNVDTQKIEKEIDFPGLGEILNPTWSPDGTRIAFSALTGGLTDLYIYDLRAGALRQMTDDAFGDIHPAWSPDGKTIAFVTDRFSADLTTLSCGYYELALLDPLSGEIKRLPTFAYCKNINPQWSLDSKSIFFVSDQNGIDNIYRYELASARISQVTNLFSGVSGITSLSPALSSAAKTAKLVYSTYEQGHFSIYAIDAESVMTGQPMAEAQGQGSAAMLSPADRKASEVLGLLKNPLFGLPEPATYAVSSYSPKLTLDYFAPPSMAIGADPYGSYVGGGLALYFSDMMGYHNLAIMGETSNRLIDTTLLVGYQNSQSRWNWGAVAERIPYVYGYYDEYLADVYGQPALVDQQYLFHQIEYQLGTFASYPFSTFQRVEFGAGASYINFKAEIFTYAYSLIDGSMLINAQETVPSPKDMIFGYAAAALVYDSSIFGATSPILGQSYRLEVSPNVGSVSFYTLLADYRRYFMPLRPFTLAFRIMHYGRYGKDADDERLWPMYIGWETLVRGYDYYSFNYGNNFDFNRIYGSRFIVANAELRFPLLGLLHLGRGYYGAWPLEFLAFYDMGVAWNGSSHPVLNWNSTDPNARIPVRSAGIGLRTNLFGYLVLGVDLVRPFDRTDTKWVWLLTLSPGF
jgi:Tol biopolymer transport system component